MLQRSGGEGFAAIAPNAGELPHAVKAPAWALFGSAVLFGGGGFLAAASAIFSPDLRASAPLPLDLVAVILWGVCAWRVALVRQPFVVFHPDRFEKREILGWRSIPRSEISGIGAPIQSRYGSRYVLIYPRPGAGRPVRLNAGLLDDPVVARWLAGAPNPVAEAVEADHAAVLADPRYGASERERKRRLALAKQAMLAVNIMGIAAGVWLLVLGGMDPVAFAVAALCSAVGAAIVVGSKGLVVWFPSRRNSRPSAVGALAPLEALVARAFGAHVLAAEPAIGAAIVIAAAVAALAILRPGQTAKAAAAALVGAIGAGLAAYGVLVFGDVAFDGAPGRDFPTTVEGKHINHGRHNTYYLRVGSWNGRPTQDVSVGWRLYDRSDVGDAICVAEHPGALGIGWFSIDRCAPDE